MQLSQIAGSWNHSHGRYNAGDEGNGDRQIVSGGDSKKHRRSRFERVNTKADLRAELDQATRAFLRDGGKVKAVPDGASAWQPGTRPPPSRPLFEEPRSERTPVPEVVATIEARRESMRSRAKPAPGRARKRPRRKVIYDDFGEPIRRVWVEE